VRTIIAVVLFVDCS